MNLSLRVLLFTAIVALALALNLGFVQHVLSVNWRSVAPVALAFQFFSWAACNLGLGAALYALRVK